jgi:cytoskeleton protein RodZ
MTEATLNPAEPERMRDSGKPTPGEFLRKLREEKGHTHAAVGSALHLTVHYIKALEGDEYGKLPGLTFVKGYLRAYTIFLGADVDKVLASFDEHIAGLLDAGMHTARVERSKRRQDQALRWAIGAGFVVVAGLAAGWWFMSGRDTPDAGLAQTAASAQQATVTAAQSSAAVAPRSSTQQTGTVTAPTPVAANTYMPALPPTLRTTMPGESVAVASDAVVAPAQVITNTDSAATDSAATAADTAAATVTPNANGARQVSLIGVGEDELRVTFNGNSWIEVDDGSMVRLYNDQLSAGDTLTIRGEAPFRVLLGDAEQVEVSVNATPIDISPDIRQDSTARLVLDAPAVQEAPL